ncbi:hypothetical protein U8C35_06380 [Sinorhizobium medicae]|uniref:hypothetical protein n=1 Tax=Sinorhizobium medicae TaxID=110321 RepID=UPI002AF6C63A|nr:hypothetical protein [Sinorhizobium medicae]WQO60059.1 hypothetical protein U8C35_06380 [Sinorhizobium medicae]
MNNPYVLQAYADIIVQVIYYAVIALPVIAILGALVVKAVRHILKPDPAAEAERAEELARD